MSSFTKESILKNTNEDELFSLFEEFLIRLKDNDGVKITNSEIDNIEWVILDKTKGEIIKEMIRN